jgi:hypothetical protein
VIVFVKEAHWTDSNARGWDEMRRGPLRSFHPHG